MNRDYEIGQIKALITASHEKIVDWLEFIVLNDGGKKNLDSRIQIFDIHNFNGFSGYNFWLDGILVGQLQLATLQACGFVIYRRLFIDGQISESYQYYNQEGFSSYTANSLDGNPIYYNSINMDPTSPIINHLYNILSFEYDQTMSGFSRTRLIFTIEKLLNDIYRNPKTFVSANGKTKDMALRNIYSEISKTEQDPILTWSERQAIYRNLKMIRSKIMRTKKRVHRFTPFIYGLHVFANDLKTKIALVKQRPINNLTGMLYQLTLGNLLWFSKTVKANLGLSIAMAIYGPFTFYFITQPMNPHAMWAVGKVRNAYIQMTKEMENIISPDDQKNKKDDQVLLADASGSAKLPTKTVSDDVTTAQASIAKNISLPDNRQEESWEQRMSNFKAMQINYEGNLIFAARMGRIEQIENQLNFPLVAESAYKEISFYEKEIRAKLQWVPNLSSSFKNFLHTELETISKVKVYIWHKMAQFFLDHPFIVVDQANEQPLRDFYTGRGFVFMKQITTDLMDENMAMAPATHQKVLELAKTFESKKINGRSVMETLNKNSFVFSQKDAFDTDALRNKLSGHWETLFLQQNKKQEASSFGLQMYTYSVRNMLWSLQTIYSSKLEELGSLAFKHNMDNTNTANTRASDEISETYASILNLVMVEYVSFSKELSKLKNDREFQTRNEIITLIKDSIEERDKLFGLNREVARN